MEKLKSKFKSNPLFVVFFTVFVDLVGFGILIPVIPQLLTNPHSQYFLLPNGFSINQGYIIFGFLTAIYPLMQFVATPILGQLSDKYGRKRILAISLSGTCLSYLIFAFGIITKNLPLLFISRAFDGITGGNVSVAQAAIADITTPENRSKNFGLIGAAFGLGFVIGPYIGGKLSDPNILSWFNATTPFFFAAILSFINVLCLMLIFPETNIHLDKLKKLNIVESVVNITKAFNLRSLRSIFLTIFVFNAGFTFFTTFASVFFIYRFGWNQGNIGDFFAYVGIWISISQAVVTRQISKHLSEDQVLKFSLLLTGVGILAIFLANQWWQLLIIVPFFAIFNGLSLANTSGLISRSVDDKVQGEVLGISSSVQALAQSLPPMISGYIPSISFTLFGLLVKFTPETPILFSSITIIISGILFILFYKSKKLIK